MTSDEIENHSMYELVSLDPTSWIDQARLLLRSARLSLDELNRINALQLSPNDKSQRRLSFIQSYMMLSGFAIENAIKGLLVCRLTKPRSLNDPTFKKIFKHNLNELMPSDIPIGNEEKELLKRLTEYTMWGGRYAMSKQPSEYHSAVAENKLSLTMGRDEELINGIFFKLDRLVTNEYEN